MRKIEVSPGLRLTFPGRTEEFDQGVEIGMIALLLDEGKGFTRWISSETLGAAERLAEHFGYHTDVLFRNSGWASVEFTFGKRRPKLVLVKG